tara:strand:- start:180 stop:512 length:333 start_codon:yes stop_codon:yes gene_type:complete
MKKYHNIVYSTEKNFSIDTNENKNQVTEISPNKQNLKLHLNRLPGNRITTIIKGYIGTDKELLKLSKFLKKTCGVGGSVKNNTILVQGNHREKIMKLLIERGFKVTLSGG